MRRTFSEQLLLVWLFLELVTDVSWERGPALEMGSPSTLGGIRCYTRVGLARMAFPEGSRHLCDLCAAHISYLLCSCL